MTLILNHQDIQHRIRRIAYQIYETHLDQKEIILAGIEGNGYTFAQRLEYWLTQISPIDVILCKVSLDKKNPIKGVHTSLSSDQYREKAIVLVDDVLNSGLTLIYGVRHFLDVPVKSFTTAVLVNRNHKRFPIKADFKGISLSTSLQEHIRVELTEGNYSAYLE
ncbi:MAG: phosphoribosyltransferase family protein [Capnocytophaga sp.]|nr:phosphoribosyltransferase family protein [Capnocytophaga sp.]